MNRRTHHGRRNTRKHTDTTMEDTETPEARPDGYAGAFDIYHQRGWSVVPIPKGRKKWPPKGYTGRDGKPPSYADMLEWSRGRPDDGMAIPLPRTVIGVDVDHYDRKRGGYTLAEAGKRWGKLPPTYRSTSRADDVNGIRLFRTPEGVELVTQIEFPELGLGGIEVCQKHHRYVMCWPSIHPDTAARYQWYADIDGTVMDHPPALDDIPELPARWLDALTQTTHNGADLGPDSAIDVRGCLTKGEPSQRVSFKLGRALSELYGPNCRHDEILKYVLGLLRCGKNGEPGVKRALNALSEAFVNRVAKDRSGGRDEAKREFHNFIYDKEGRPTARVVKLLADPDYDDEPEAGENAQNEFSTSSATDYDERIKYRVELIRLDAEARRRFAAEGRKTTSPPVTLTEFLAKPDDEAQYRIDRLLPTGGRVLLSAGYKAGKTAMRDNLIRSLADERPFLGEFTVRRATVTLIDVEVDERQLRRWLRCQMIKGTEGVRVKPLRGEVSTFDILDADVRAGWARWLAGSEVVVLDCLRPVLDALGLSEDKDAGQFLVAFDELLAESGASEAVVIHHMGHTGERSRGDSRLLDWPDVNWRIVKDKDADDPDNPDVDRYFSAYGRDVEVRESLLDYTPETRSLMYVPHRSRANAKVQALIPHLVKLLTDQPAMSKTKIEGALKGLATRAVVREAIDTAKTEGKIYTSEEGKNHAVCHFVSPSQAA